MEVMQRILDFWLDYQRIYNNYAGISAAVMHDGNFVYQ